MGAAAAYNRGTRAIVDEATRRIEASRATNDARALLWRDLLEQGIIMHFIGAGGATVTCGPHITATGGSQFSAYRDGGDSRWRGVHIGSAWSVALFLIDNIGRARPYKVTA